MKEYDEAREKIAEFLWYKSERYNLSKLSLDKIADHLREYYYYLADQILSLKGDGWRLALLGDEWVHSTLTPHRRVIWQGEE